MSLVYSFDRERIKPLVAAYLNADFNFNEISPELKKPMRIYVHDTIPHIWLSDGYHFIECHFTKDAINDFRKNHSNVKFAGLRDKILVVTKWRLIKKFEDSKKSWTSYQNLSVHLVVENFRPLLYERPQPRQVATSQSLFRDPEIQSMIRSKRQEMIQNHILHQHLFFNPTRFEVPSAKDIFDSHKLLPDPYLQGSHGEPMSDEIDTSSNTFKEQSNQAIRNISSLITKSEVLRCDFQPVSRDTLDQDKEDFKEIKDIMLSSMVGTKTAANEDVTMIDTTVSQNVPAEQEQNYQDIKRLLIQEKGEEEYFFLNSRKSKQLQEMIDDEFTRQELTTTYEHFYQSQEQSRLEFQRMVQIKLQQQQEQKKRKAKKIVRYRLGLQASEIKEKMLRFMNTYNPNKGQGILEERVELTVEPRERAYSQDFRNDRSELIETRTINSQHHKGFCLSQFDGPLSVFNDGDITESEHEEEGMEDPLAYEQKQQVRNLIAKVKPTFSLFKKYYEWFQQHEVTTKAKYDILQETMRREAAERAVREAEAERYRLEREENERQRELKRLEQERYRQEQLELEKQRKAERKALKLKQAEDEKLRKQQELEDQEYERLLALEEEQAQQQMFIEEQRQLKLQKEREEQQARELALRQEQEQARQEQARLQALREEEARARIEEKRRLAEEERLQIEEAKRKAFVEEKERLKREAEAILRRQDLERQQRAIEVAAKEQAEKMLREQQVAENLRKEQERRKQEEAQEREKLKAQAAAQALAAEQDRQRRAAEEKKRKEDQERAELYAALQKEKRQKDEQLAREREEQKRLEEMAIAALRSAGTQSQGKVVMQEEDSDHQEQRSSCSSEENDNERTAGFPYANGAQESEEDPILETKGDNYHTPSPDQTQNVLVMLQQSPGSFVDQNAYSSLDQPTMSLNQVLGTQLAQQTQSRHSSQDKKPSNKRKHASSQSDEEDQDQGSEASSRKSRSRSLSSHSSNQSSSGSSSGSESRSSSSLSSQESGSDVDSDSSSSEEEMAAIYKMLVQKIMKKKLKKSKSKKSKKNKKSKSQQKEMLAKLAQMTSKNKKKKKKHSQSSSKKHKHKHSSDKAKRKEERASSKIATTAFSVENTHHMNGGPQISNGHAFKSSPSPQKVAFSPNGNGFKSSNFETTAGSTLEATFQSSMVVKQVSPPPIRISPTVPLERAVTSFDSWKSQAETKAGIAMNGNGFHHYPNSENVPLNGQHSGNNGMKPVPQVPWELSSKQMPSARTSSENMDDDIRQLQILQRMERPQKRARHT